MRDIFGNIVALNIFNQDHTHILKIFHMAALDFGLNHLGRWIEPKDRWWNLFMEPSFIKCSYYQKDWTMCLTKLHSLHVGVSFYLLNHQRRVQEDDCVSLSSLSGVLVALWKVSLLVVCLFKITFCSLATWNQVDLWIDPWNMKYWEEFNLQAEAVIFYFGLFPVKKEIALLMLNDLLVLDSKNK